MTELATPPADLLVERDPPWPTRAWSRWALRLALAAPLVVLAVVADARDVPLPSHDVLLDRAALVREGGYALAGIGWAFPPIPVAVATALSTSLALGIAGALFGGVAIHAVLERLVQRDLQPWLIVVMAAAVLAVPSMWFGILDQTGVVASLAFFAIAARGYVEFIFRHDTEGGYVAGLFLGLAVLADPIALFYTLAMAAGASSLAHYRFAIERYAAQATAAVLCFPAVLAAASWMYLEWRFQGTFLVALRSEPGFADFDDGVAATLREAYLFTGEAVLRCPLFAVVGAMLWRRRRTAVSGYALPIVAILVARFVGLPFDHVAALGTLTIVAGATVPYRPRRWATAGLVAGVVGVLVINTLAPPDPDGVDAFLDALF